jgi:hypothetical protein
VRLAALKDSMKNCINQTFLLIRALVTWIIFRPTNDVFLT